MNLSPYRDLINNINPLGQRLYFNPVHLRDFNYKNPIVSNDMIFISDNYQNGNSQSKQVSISYNNYVTEIHSIANELNLKTDKIKYFLFNGI